MLDSPLGRNNIGTIDSYKVEKYPHSEYLWSGKMPLNKITYHGQGNSDFKINDRLKELKPNNKEMRKNLFGTGLEEYEKVLTDNFLGK